MSVVDGILEAMAIREWAMSEVGRTHAVGWEIGVSGTLPHPLETVWALLAAPRGTALWLGPDVGALPLPRTRSVATDGTEVELRSLRPHDRVRVVLRPAGWDHDTTAQVTVSRSGADRTVLRFHQERLADADERERARTHWTGVLDRFRTALDASGG